MTDRLYTVGIGVLPRDTPPTFGKLVLLSHKSFLAAATLVGQAQPDDAAPITRRAIEMARLSWALKSDPANAKQWIAGEQRQRRWRERQEGKRPTGQVKLQYKNVPRNDHLEQLDRIFGIISDAKVHFTPEYFGTQEWRIELHGENGTMFHSYFDANKRSIDGAFLLLNGVHHHMLRIFDQCLDGVFSGDKGWQVVLATLRQVGAELSKEYKEGAPQFEPPEEELWT